jgi:hypothetical protein
MDTLDLREERLLDFLERYFESHGYPPSTREMLTEMGKDFGFRFTDPGQDSAAAGSCNDIPKSLSLNLRH